MTHGPEGIGNGQKIGDLLQPTGQNSNRKEYSTKKSGETARLRKKG